MKKRVIITEYKEHIIMAVKEENRFVSFKLNEEASPVGRIINGRVEKRAENIGSCFIRLSKEMTGFLDSSAMKGETSLPVQIVKEGRGEKRHKVSRTLSVAGMYAVLYHHPGKENTADKSLLFSRKLSADERRRLDEGFCAKLSEDEKFRKLLSPFQILLRTNAARVELSEVVKELCALKENLSEILRYHENRPDYTVLYEPPKPIIKAVMDLPLDQIEEIITDLKPVYEEIKSAYYDKLPAAFRDQIPLTLYQDSFLPLFRLVSMEAGLSGALSKRVWLSSGSFIVIEQTEALVAIDVNSGKNERRSGREETILAVNREAALEIVRQLKLRNLSGIIIIDFINMKRAESRDALRETLREAIRQEDALTTFVDITPLYLVELTRKREGLSLREQMEDILG
ncbi:MAG: ribonuclease E/G [Lachnospiraceae bacterium]|nr:ribonuclease E/G [Lachnospiraceae bacterium]